MDFFTHIEDMKDELVKTIHYLHSKGWAPATSSNYSFKDPKHPQYWISASGIDKSAFNREDLLLIDSTGNQMLVSNAKTSDETLLHTAIYSSFEEGEVGCVLHTHSVFNTVLSKKVKSDEKNEKFLNITGYEMQKALFGVESHEETVMIPVFENTQNIEMLAKQVFNHLQLHINSKCFLINGHGLYTWGKTIKDAKRHVEALEFLFEAEYNTLVINNL
jgi:methylthioribulose-1-phosphate dehydratase